MSEDCQPTRRGVLALAGSTVLAGCGGLPGLGGSSPPSLDGARLDEITGGDVPEIPQTVPVTIAADHVQGHVDRTGTLLSEAPLPFDDSELPNGAMREEMNAAAEQARSTLDDAENVRSPYEAIATLRDARGKARTVATAWAYADEGLRREDLEDDADTLAADVDAFRDRLSYVGEDPVRALLVYEPVESLVAVASQNAEGRPENPRTTRRPENLVTVTEFAAALERGRSALTDATHLFDRLHADLTRSRDLAGTFESALDELFVQLETETSDFDGNDPVSAVVDADIDDSPVEVPLEYLHSDVARTGSITTHRDDGELASALVAVHREFTRLRAFQDLRDRVESGENYALESTEDVAAIRESAVTAIETGLDETAEPGLSRNTLHNMAGLVENVDSEIGPYDAQEQVPVDWIRRDVGEYIYVAAVARVTPDVSETVAETLRS